jgi:hypothetical protein
MGAIFEVLTLNLAKKQRSSRVGVYIGLTGGGTVVGLVIYLLDLI